MAPGALHNVTRCLFHLFDCDTNAPKTGAVEGHVKRSGFRPSYHNLKSVRNGARRMDSAGPAGAVLDCF